MRPWLISALTLAADQLTKYLIVQFLMPGASIPLLPPALSLTHVQNTGAAFGLFKGQQWLFIGMSVVVIAWLARELMAKPSMARSLQWACALVLGGALGNLIDRLRFNFVVDFLDCHVWPVFNVGDSAITIGVMWLILHNLFDARRHVTRDT